MLSKCARSLGRTSLLTEKTVFNHTLKKSLSSQEVFNREHKYCAHNYHPLPVALSKGQGIFLYKIIVIKSKSMAIK